MTWQAGKAKAKQAVRPINILTLNRFNCIVLRVRASGNSIAGRKRSATHLENCTGKTFREKLKSRKIPVRSDGSGTHKSSGYFLISIVLGMRK